MVSIYSCGYFIVEYSNSAQKQNGLLIFQEFTLKYKTKIKQQQQKQKQRMNTPECIRNNVFIKQCYGNYNLPGKRCITEKKKQVIQHNPQ